MHLGIFSWYGYKPPLPLRLKKIKEVGFDSTMLWWGNELVTNQSPDAEILNLAIDLGLIIENIHVPFDEANLIWSTNKEIRNKFIARHIHYLECCSQYHIPMIVMHISKGVDIKEPNNAGLDAMQGIIETAEKTGVIVAIENTRKPNLIEAILDTIKSDYLGLCYDTSHGKLYESTEFGLLKKYPDRLKCLHISDNDGVEDRHWCIGEGIIDWTRFIGCFPYQRYKGTLAVEVYPKNQTELELEHLYQAYTGIKVLRDKIYHRYGDYEVKV